MNEIRERRVREGLAPAARLGIQRELNLVVALLDPRVGERHLSADRPSRRLLGLLAALLQPSLLRPLDALLGAAYEARLRRVSLTERLEPFTLPDNLSLVRQVVLAVGVHARLASEQHPTDRRGFAPAFVARVVRTRPPRRLGEFVLRDADALGVDADGAQVAADDVTAVPAVLARERVAVIATRHLRAAAFLGLGLLLGLAGKHALLALLQGVVVSLEHGVAVNLNRGLCPGPFPGDDLRLKLRGDVLHALRLLRSLAILTGLAGLELLGQHVGGYGRSLSLPFGKIGDGVLHLRLQVRELFPSFRPARVPVHQNLQVGVGRGFAGVLGKNRVDAESQHPVEVALVHSLHVLSLLGAAAADHLLQEELLLRSLLHALLDGARGDQAVHVNRLFLPDAVHPRHRLRVNLRVPIGIVQNARVRRLQVDAEAARPGGQQEGEHRGVWAVERGDVDRPLHSVGAPV